MINTLELSISHIKQIKHENRNQSWSINQSRCMGAKPVWPVWTMAQMGRGWMVQLWFFQYLLLLMGISHCLGGSNAPEKETNHPVMSRNINLSSQWIQWMGNYIYIYMYKCVCVWTFTQNTKNSLVRYDVFAYSLHGYQKTQHSYWKSPFIVDILLKHDGSFHGYVKLPEGISTISLDSPKIIHRLSI